jgi:hypothetical protein
MTMTQMAELLRVGTMLATSSGGPSDVARSLVSLALEFVPVDELRLHLTDEAERRADIAADLAEAAKGLK